MRQLIKKSTSPSRKSRETASICEVTFDNHHPNDKVNLMITANPLPFHRTTPKRDSAWIAKDQANARLKLGMCGVGTWVLLSIFGVFVLPSPTIGASLTIETLNLGFWIALYLLISFPFDYHGGVRIPRRFASPSRTASQFTRRWIRGAGVHGLALWTIGVLMLVANQVGEWALTTLVFTIVVIGLIQFQLPLARSVASFKTRSSQAISARQRQVELDTDETAFSGGITGWPGFERVLLPSKWKKKLGPDAYERLVFRRNLAISSGSRTRGLLAVLAWVSLGFVLALWINHETMNTALGIVRFALWSTLWQFLGLLILPTLSRRAAIALDYQQVKRGTAKNDQIAFIKATSELEDGEDQRSTFVETIFHPLPSVYNRLKALDQLPRQQGAWNANRLMLFLAWASLGLLSRAVHCNAGRPELWVLPPVD